MKDSKSNLKLVQSINAHVGMLFNYNEIIEYLDINPRFLKQILATLKKLNKQKESKIDECKMLIQENEQLYDIINNKTEKMDVVELKISKLYNLTKYLINKYDDKGAREKYLYS